MIIVIIIINIAVLQSYQQQSTNFPNVNNDEQDGDDLEKSLIQYLKNIKNISISDGMNWWIKWERNLVDGLLAKFNYDPNGTVHELFDLEHKIVDENLLKLGDCYDKTIVGKDDHNVKELDIFHRPIGEIVETFFVSMIRIRIFLLIWPN